MALAGVAGRCGCGWWVQAHSVRMGLPPGAGRGLGRRGGAVAVGGGWFRPIRCAWGSFLVLVVALAGVAGPLRWVAGGSGPFGAHGAPSLCWSWPWPAWRGRCGGWLVVQAHSVRMGLLPCAGRGPGRRGGAVAVGGWWVRHNRCAWCSLLVLVVALAGVAGPLRWVAGGSGPFGAHGAPSLCWSWPWPAWRGRCGWVAGGSGPFGAHWASFLCLSRALAAW